MLFRSMRTVSSAGKIVVLKDGVVAEPVSYTHLFGADGGYSFISSLAEDNKLAVQLLAELERKLRARGDVYKRQVRILGLEDHDVVGRLGGLVLA